jgi:hypothetical protein
MVSTSIRATSAITDHPRSQPRAGFATSTRVAERLAGFGWALKDGYVARLPAVHGRAVRFRSAHTAAWSLPALHACSYRCWIDSTSRCLLTQMASKRRAVPGLFCRLPV